jgi:hypothetical protein
VSLADPPMAASTPLPDMEHPVVLACSRVLKPGTSERFTIDEAGEAQIEKALEAHADDPGLTGGVLGLLGIMHQLYEHEASKGAAAAIVRALARSRPRLRRLRPNLDETSSSIARKGAEFLKFAAREPDAARLDAPPPEDAVSVASLVSKLRRRIH